MGKLWVLHIMTCTIYMMNELDVVLVLKMQKTDNACKYRNEYIIVTWVWYQNNRKENKPWRHNKTRPYFQRAFPERKQAINMEVSSS